MALDFITPGALQPFGPGYGFAVHETLPGPWPTTAFWDLEVVPSTGESQVAHSRVPNQLNDANGIMGLVYGTVPPAVTFAPQLSTLAPGATAKLIARHYSDTTTVISQNSIDVTWEPQAGVSYLLSEQIKALPAAQGGFTTSDREQLAQTKALAAFPMGLWGPALEAALQSLSQFPYGAELITPDRTGGGALSRPGGGFNVNALGIYFEVVSKPPGIGVDEGAPPSYEIPALELGLISQIAGGTDVNKDSHWFSDANGLWIWNFDVPFQVVYWIQPGVTVRFYWLLFNPLLEQLLGPGELLAQADQVG